MNFMNIITLENFRKIKYNLEDFIEDRIIKYEIKAEKYFRKYLHKEDSEIFRKFILNFGNNLGLESIIIAVGSSTFPRKHWKFLKILEKEYQESDIPTEYKNIDIIVSPKDNMNLDSLKKIIENTLDKLNYSYETNDKLKEAMIIKELSNIYDEKKLYKDTIYTKNISIKTYLSNFRQINIILGNGVVFSSDERLRLERVKNTSFSLIYDNRKK